MDSEQQDDARAKRLDRLVTQLHGYHIGYLDLRGRHKARYLSLLLRWKRLSKDFLDVLQASGSIPGDTSVPVYQAWRRFMEKWHIPHHIAPGVVSQKIYGTLHLLQDGSEPIFQKQCLHDLPIELLREVFEHAQPDEVLKLASSSRLLRLVGQPFAFRIRRIQLRYEPRYTTSDDGSFPKKKWLKIRHEVYDQVKYLEAHPELANEVQVMHIADRWRSQRDTHLAHKAEFIELYKDIMPGVIDRFSRAISSTPRLTTLNLTYIKINLPMAQALSQLQVLQSLDLFHCSLVDGAAGFLSCGVVHCSTTTHLRLTFDNGPSLSMYYILPAFPNLRTLIMGSLVQPQSPISPPPESIWEDIQFFSTLERLTLNYIPWYTLGGFASWFSSKPSLPRLTHLKVHSRLGMDDADIIDLLSTIERSPLQVLIIDGLADGSLFLVDIISLKLPSLLGLTLYRRHSDRQGTTSLSEWPHPTYEYADRLSGFTKLQHFAWNCKTGYETEYTTKSLLHFEEGEFPPPPDSALGVDAEYHDEWRNDHTADEDHVLALPFAAACPTLQSFAVGSHPYREKVSCQIKRVEGKEEFVVEPERISWVTGGIYKKWDVMVADGNVGWTEV
ncbi:hypothetical protein BDN72DRAFT_845837 [Pluteus cervinus]|uniref:Uncharacterized protein n=1 Tax=Pluteus cervinus TaxID=181527 RepID=A0ACD3AI55_9AGAR|nr:hypothetical protein BDN72DRAFT_845837 [Pluteus cervinus]